MSRTKKDTKRHKIDVSNLTKCAECCVGGIPKWFKNITRRKRRHVIKVALRRDRLIPKFRNSYGWDWW